MVSSLYFYFIWKAEKKLLLLHKPACLCLLLPFQYSILLLNFSHFLAEQTTLSLSLSTYSCCFCYWAVTFLAFSFYIEKESFIFHCFTSLFFVCSEVFFSSFSWDRSASFDLLCFTEKGFCFLTRPSLDHFKVREEMLPSVFYFQIVKFGVEISGSYCEC